MRRRNRNKRKQKRVLSNGTELFFGRLCETASRDGLIDNEEFENLVDFNKNTFGRINHNAVTFCALFGLFPIIRSVIEQERKDDFKIEINKMISMRVCLGLNRDVNNDCRSSHRLVKTTYNRNLLYQIEFKNCFFCGDKINSNKIGVIKCSGKDASSHSGASICENCWDHRGGQRNKKALDVWTPLEICRRRGDVQMQNYLHFITHKEVGQKIVAEKKFEWLDFCREAKLDTKKLYKRVNSIVIEAIGDNQFPDIFLHEKTGKSKKLQKDSETNISAKRNNKRGSKKNRTGASKF